MDMIPTLFRLALWRLHLGRPFNREDWGDSAVAPLLHSLFSSAYVGEVPPPISDDFLPYINGLLDQLLGDLGDSWVVDYAPTGRYRRLRPDPTPAATNFMEAEKLLNEVAATLPPDEVEAFVAYLRGENESFTLKLTGFDPARVAALEAIIKTYRTDP